MPDVIVAAVVGLVTGWCVGPTLPVTSQWLARSSIINFLLQIAVVGLALASQLFPYSTGAPKRVVFQQTFVTAGHLKFLQRIKITNNHITQKSTVSGFSL